MPHEKSTTEQRDKRPLKKTPRKPDALPADTGEPHEMSAKEYRKQMAALRPDFAALKDWLPSQQKKVVVLLDGYPGSGTSGVAARVANALPGNAARVVALGSPDKRERKQWYYQRYVRYLPPAGEVTIFDGSWYRRAVVEQANGNANLVAYQEFLRTCPAFEAFLGQWGITLVKLWLRLSDEELEKRLHAEYDKKSSKKKRGEPALSVEQRIALHKEAQANILECGKNAGTPWIIVEADDKRAARIESMRQVLQLVPGRAPVLDRLPVPV
jgi:polyphosphate kinase 2 (PPK2 family)